MELTKKCNECGQVKNVSEFYPRKDRNSYNSYCKNCDLKKAKKWRNKNPEKIKVLNKKYREENPEKIKKWGKKSYQKHKVKRRIHKEEYKKNNFEKVKQQERESTAKWIKNNPEKVKEYRKKRYQKNKEKEKKDRVEWRRKNPEKVKAQGKKWYENNKVKNIKRSTEWRKKNPERISEWRKEWYKNNPEKKKEHLKMRREKNKKKYKIDIHFKIRCNISGLIGQRLKQRLFSKNGKSTLTLLPYTIDNLIQHLEKQFEPWMNWSNHGVGKGKWQIDHIIPDLYFNYKSVDDEEFQKCWALDNLQPLDAIENIKKSNRLDYYNT